MESSGKPHIFPGSQEVIGSIPICSTQSFKGLRSIRFATLSFLPEICQEADEKSDYAHPLISMSLYEKIYQITYVWYLPFDIPGKQMAATLPPLGVFIELKYKNEKIDDKCSILTHEMIYWEQYVSGGNY